MRKTKYMVPPSLHRIVATWRLGAEDPKSLLPAFEKAVHDFLGRVPDADIRWLLDHPEFSSPTRETYEAHKEEVKRAYDIQSALTMTIYRSVQSKYGQAVLHNSGQRLFLAILQSYELPKQVRTKVEEANRFFSKVRKPSIPKDPKDLVEAYQKIEALMRNFLEAAKKGVAGGKAHSEGTTVREAGPFKLINTGGFDEKSMDSVTKLVTKAADLLQKKRLGKICYGDIQVTKTIGKSSQLAFYLVNADEVFVRANAPATQDTLRTVLHELGHRMEFRFLKGKKNEIEHVYALLSRASSIQDRSQASNKPQKGDSIVAKGATFYVINVEYSPRARGGYTVHVAMAPDAVKATHRVPLAAFNALKAGVSETEEMPSGAFISAYAKSGGPSENFAEMFAFYCLDKLPPAQVEMLEQILF